MASQRVHGITIDIGMNTSGVAEGFSDINKSLNSTSRELKTIDKLLKDDEQNITLLSQKQGLLADQIQKTTDKLRDLNKAKEQADKDDSIDKNSREYRELERDIEATEKSLYRLNQEAEKTDDALEDARASANGFGNSLQQTGQDVVKFSSLLLANLLSGAIIGGFNLLVDSMKSLSREALEWAKDFRELEVYEKQFENNIRNTADATDDEIASLKALAKQKERNGVISAKAITSAYQELATYVEETESIEGLTDALVDMSAQQYGVDATEESVRNIATTLGKALANGDYSGLTRLGYGFTDAQKRIMEYGTEAQRVAVLNDVISSSIGGMNQALQETDSGRIFALSQYLGDVKNSIGEVVSEIEVELIGQLLPELQPFIDEGLKWIIDHKDDFVSTIQAVVEWLTSSEMQQFYSDFAQVVMDLGSIFATIIDVLDKFGVWEGLLNAIKGIVTGIKELFDQIADDMEKIKSGGIGEWMRGNYSSYSASGGDYFAMGSGGFMSGGMMSGSLTINNNFTINGIEQLSHSRLIEVADVITDRVNENLGRMYA